MNKWIYTTLGFCTLFSVSVVAQHKEKETDTIVIDRSADNSMFFRKHLDLLDPNSSNLSIEPEIKMLPEYLAEAGKKDSNDNTMPIFVPKGDYNIPIEKPKGHYVMPIYGSGSTRKDGYTVINPLESKNLHIQKETDKE